MSNCVRPYQGDPYDLVARLTWLKDQVECTKPGRERVWMEFDEVISLVELVLEVNASMRRTLKPLARDQEERQS